MPYNIAPGAQGEEIIDYSEESSLILPAAMHTESRGTLSYKEAVLSRMQASHRRRERDDCVPSTDLILPILTH